MLVCTGIGLSSIWGLKKTSLSIHYSSSSTGGKSTALIKCCIFQMNKNHFGTPGEQHNYLSTAPYSQHHLHHIQLFQYVFFWLGWQFAQEPGAGRPHLTYLLPISSSMAADPGARPPPSCLSVPRRCRVGRPHVTGSSCTPALPPLLPPTSQLQPSLATKDEELTFCGICCYSQLCCIFCLDLFSSK